MAIAVMGAVVGQGVAVPSAVAQFWTTGLGGQVNGLSADGRLAVGGSAAAYRWTAATGPDRLWQNEPELLPLGAWGVTGDGRTIVGDSFVRRTVDTYDVRAYRWAGPGQWERLGRIAGYQDSVAKGVSDDGRVIVGNAKDRAGWVSQAFRRTGSGGMQALGFLQRDGFYSEANAVSRDGSTIAGVSAGTGTLGFVWRVSTGLQRRCPRCTTPGSGLPTA